MRRFWLSVSALTLLGVCVACSDNDPDSSVGNAAGTGAAAGNNAAAGPGAAAGSGAAGQAGSSPLGAAGEGGFAGDAPMGNGAAPPVAGGAAGEAGSTQVAGAAGTNETDVPAVVAVAVEGNVSAIDIAPLTLTPAFSASTHDYYVRCSAGDNALTLTTTDDNGAKSWAITLQPDQAVVVGDAYWVRCLPPDFPAITVTQTSAPPPGYYLLNSATYGAVFDVNGVPVWYARGTMPVNVESPAPNTLSFMRNATLGPAAYYEIRALDTGTVTKVMAPDDSTDDHEMRVLPNGDYLVFTDPEQPEIDLTGLGNYDRTSTLLGCRIEELDSSGSVVWSWLASDHVDPVQESLFQITTTVDDSAVVDAYHCNGIDVDSTGNLLVSMRHTNSAFYVDRSTGKVLWKLGGSAYNKDGAALISVVGDSEGGFSLQHDARFQANGDVSLFDDHGMGLGAARGIEFSIDHDANTATPAFQFLGSGISQYEGSFRRYADGESVISWGYVPNDLRVMTEIDANGSDVFDIAFSAGNASYRAIKVPLTQLDIALLRRDTAH